MEGGGVSSTFYLRIPDNLVLPGAAAFGRSTGKYCMKRGGGPAAARPSAAGPPSSDARRGNEGSKASLTATFRKSFHAIACKIGGHEG